MSLFTELKRRNVFRVAAAYIVTAWLVIQVVETILPAFGFGDAAIRYVTIAFAVGLIPMLVLSWVFEWTPEGIKREAEVDDGAPASLKAAKRFDRMILVVLALALGYFAFDKFVLEPQREAEEAVQQQAELEGARQEGRTEALVESYGDKSIAVLPFRDMSPEGDQEYFSEGIAEELLNILARESQLRVISRTSSFAFKDQALEVPEIAKRLKVGHILEGSVRKAGDTVRITAQLIEARSDTHLWSQTWDRELTDILAIQDEIAAAVAESLQAVLLRPIRSATAREMSEAELEAYELVLKGRHLLNLGNADAYQRAVPFYEQAIAIAPDYAPAHAGLAKVLRQLDVFGALTADEESDARIEAALDRALELDPDEPDALTTRGMLLVSTETGFSQAREYWRKALSVNPNDGDALRWLGWSYSNVDSVRYLDFMEQAYGVAPTSVMVNFNLVIALRRFERWGEALLTLADWHDLYPDSAWPIGLACDHHYIQWQLDRALRCYYHVFRLAPESADREIDGLVWLLVEGVSMGGSELAMQWVDRHVANNPGRELAHFQKVILTALSGREEEARRLLAELERHPNGTLAAARCHVNVTREYGRSRELWESGGAPGGALENWDVFAIVDYAFVLQRTGDGERARELIDAALARVEQQMAAGAKTEFWFEFAFYAAILHALRGENSRAIEYLQRDAAHGGLSGVAALKTWPHFDGLRDDPAFQALIAEQEEANARWRERLEAEGLLVTPEEVLALENLGFDPFADVASETL